MTGSIDGGREISDGGGCCSQVHVSYFVSPNERFKYECRTGALHVAGKHPLGTTSVTTVLNI